MKKPRIVTFARYRSGCGYEYHNQGTPTSPKVRFISVWWGSPTKHAWWARMIYIYF